MERFVVLGAGAIGAGLGGRLAEAGHEVVFVARGAHGRALRDRGLELAEPDRTRVVRVPTVLDGADVSLTTDDVVLLAVKSQHTESALAALAPPRATPVVCLQNGVVNEDCAARFVDEVYGAMVWVPATLLVPGRVELHGVPPGALVFGRWPGGVDPRAEALAGAFTSAGFIAAVRPDVARWKHTKLLSNLLGPAQALCGPDADFEELAARLVEEGAAVLDAAGIDYVPQEELRGFAAPVRAATIEGAARRGGSSWQSAARGAGSHEAEQLNGTIVRLADAHRVPAPVNRRLLAAARRGHAEGWAPGDLAVEALLAPGPSVK